MTDQAQIERDGENNYVKICADNAQMFGLPFSENYSRITFREAVNKKREYDQWVEAWKNNFEQQEIHRQEESKRIYEEAKK